MNLKKTDRDLLAIDFTTLFVETPEGRIARENDPDRSPGPRFWLAGCATGNIIGFRHDVADDVAGEITALAASEPAFAAPDDLPVHLPRYERVLASTERELGLVYDLPHRLEMPDGMTLVTSGSASGERFLEDVAAKGMPENLVGLKMRRPEDLWAPWAMLMVDGEVASIAFAARLSALGAELGLDTVPHFRGKGLAAIATAAWTRLPELAARQLFYSADQSNGPSLRVVARLGLRLIGASLRLT